MDEFNNYLAHDLPLQVNICNIQDESSQKYDDEIDDEEMSEFAAPAIPYLPPIRKDRKYTLILDLDETLIHYDIDE